MSGKPGQHHVRIELCCVRRVGCCTTISLLPVLAEGDVLPPLPLEVAVMRLHRRVQHPVPGCIALECIVHLSDEDSAIPQLNFNRCIAHRHHSWHGRHGYPMPVTSSSTRSPRSIPTDGWQR